MSAQPSQLLLGSIDVHQTKGSPDFLLKTFADAQRSQVGRYLRHLGLSALQLSLVEAIPDQPKPLELTVFGESELQDWEAARIQDAESLNSFQARWEGQAEIKTFSVRAPVGLSAEQVFDDLRGFSGTDVQVVLQDPEAMSDAIAYSVDREWISLGWDVSIYPDLETVSRFIVECCGLEVPFQLIGLTGSFSTSEGALGVVNAISASLTSFAQELSVGETLRILEKGFDGALGSDEIGHARDIFGGVGISDLNRFVSEAQKL